MEIQRHEEIKIQTAEQKVMDQMKKANESERQKSKEHLH